MKKHAFLCTLALVATLGLMLPTSCTPAHSDASETTACPSQPLATQLKQALTQSQQKADTTYVVLSRRMGCAQLSQSAWRWMQLMTEGQGFSLLEEMADEHRNPVAGFVLCLIITLDQPDNSPSHQFCEALVNAMTLAEKRTTATPCPELLPTLVRDLEERKDAAPEGPLPAIANTRWKPLGRVSTGPQAELLAHKLMNSLTSTQGVELRVEAAAPSQGCSVSYRTLL